MRHTFVGGLVFATVLCMGLSRGQATDVPINAPVEVPPEPLVQSEEASPPNHRGFVGGLLGGGFAASELEPNRKAHVDASLLFAIRGGLFVGADRLGVITFELAPMMNKIDWSFRPTATFLTSFGKLRKIGRTGDWAWLWKVGVGIGGGLDCRFLVGGQLDVLTFNYKMNETVWIDFGVPSIRFYNETANTTRHAFQFVFPLGVTFAP